MHSKAFWTTLVLIAAATFPARGALLISEVCFNEVSSDTTGEWIEIYNSGPAAIDLTNYKIGDEETSGGTGTGESIFVFPVGATINPGQLQVVAISATRFQTVYGFLPTYETSGADPSVPDMTGYFPTTWDPDGTQINMSNTTDQALILDPSDVVVDAVGWGGSFNPTADITGNLDGQSIERIDPAVDTNTGADWRLGPSTSPAATRSTPLAFPVPEPTCLAMVAGAVAILGVWRRKK